MDATGRMVIDKPAGHEEGFGAVATVNLYGPRGGYIGSTPIDRRDAETAAKRLYKFMRRPQTTGAYLVTVDNGDTEPELWAFASEAKAEEFASVRSQSATVTSIGVLDDNEADALIAEESSL